MLSRMLSMLFPRLCSRTLSLIEMNLLGGGQQSGLMARAFILLTHFVDTILKHINHDSFWCFLILVDTFWYFFCIFGFIVLVLFCFFDTILKHANQKSSASSNGKVFDSFCICWRTSQFLPFWLISHLWDLASRINLDCCTHTCYVMLNCFIEPITISEGIFFKPLKMLQLLKVKYLELLPSIFSLTI